MLDDVINSFSIVDIKKVISEPVKYDKTADNCFGVCNLSFDDVIETCLNTPEYNDPLILNLAGFKMERPYKIITPKVRKLRRK